jgi:hypothetical protein
MIHQNHPGNIRWIPGCIQSCDQAANRESNDHVGAVNTRVPEQFVKLIDSIGTGRVIFSFDAIAPSSAGWIVRADSRPLRDSGLHEPPIKRESSAGDHDRRRAMPRTVQMKLVTRNIDEFARRRRPTLRRAEFSQTGQEDECRSIH